jgi:hypothetical protein
MKLKLLFLAILFFFAVNVSFAQKGDAKAKAKTYTEQLAKQLKLTPAQEKQVLAINEDTNMKLEKAKGAEDKAIKQARIKAIGAILTADQKKIFDKNFAGGKN